MKQTALTGFALLTSLDIYNEESVQNHSLGAKGLAANGDIYRYTRIISTGTDLIAGNLIVSLGR